MSSKKHFIAGWLKWLVAIGLPVWLIIACNSLTGVDSYVFPLAPCNPFTGAGCGSGLTCRFSREDAGPACRPVAAEPAAPYSVCQQDSDCPGAHLCVQNLCRKYCEAAATCGWDDARCVAVEGDAFATCTRNCDLTSASVPGAGLQACGSGARCSFIAEEGSEGYTDCFEATGVAAAGQACQADGDCLVDLSCERGRCQVPCDANAAVCEEEQRCGGFAAKAGRQLGTCCTPPSDQACDLVTDCGCSAMAKCIVAVPEPLTTACRALASPVLAPYSQCNSAVQCPRGHSCLGGTSPDGSFIGTCRRNCDTVQDCGSDGLHCLASVNSAVGYCTRGCDPLAPQGPRDGFNACGPGASCVGSTFGGTFHTDCVPAGPSDEGMPCSASLVAQCGTGLECLGGVCTRSCSPGGPECGEGSACGYIFRDARGREFGRCCPMPAGFDCDWASSCGCASNETCSAAASPVCRPINRLAVAVYAACAGDRDCPGFHTCQQGVCMRQCVAASDCGWSGAVCLPIEGASFPGAGVCSRNCDVLSTGQPAAGFQACGAGSMCKPLESAGGGVFTCVPLGLVEEDGACTSAVECAPGLACSAGLCRPFCVPGQDGCDGGETCDELDPPLPVVAGRTLGACNAAPATETVE